MDNNLGRMAAMDRRRNVRRAGHGPRPFGAPVMDRVLDADLISVKKRRVGNAGSAVCLFMAPQSL